MAPPFGSAIHLDDRPRYAAVSPPAPSSLGETARHVLSPWRKTENVALCLLKEHAGDIFPTPLSYRRPNGPNSHIRP